MGRGAAETATLAVACGKGTYIRTLLVDIGKALGGGAVMTSLCRTMANGFTLEQCHTFEEVGQMVESGTLQSNLIPTDRLFAALPKLTLSQKQSTLYQNGVKLLLERVGGFCRMRTPIVSMVQTAHFSGSLTPTGQRDSCGLARILDNLR